MRRDVSVVHVIEVENPKIGVDVPFKDGQCFKRRIRQYAVLKEVELAVPYSDSRMYRGYCKAKRCKWRIHASRLQDVRTWQIKKLPYRHNCASTVGMENNYMATNSWVIDRVINKLRKDPTIDASALKSTLEEMYKIKISYFVAWDSRQMALDEILRKWEDSFEVTYNFKLELERKSPGSIVEVEHVTIDGVNRFNRMFVALKPCVDGFINGCRPDLGIDSTVLTSKWRGQRASAIGIDDHNWMFPVAYRVFDSESTENWTWFME